MKVLHLAPFVEPGFAGGLQRYVLELARFEARLGVEVTVLTTGLPGRPPRHLGTPPADLRGSGAAEPVRVVRVGSVAVLWRTPVAPALFRRFLSLLAAEPVDVVHLHGPNPAVDALGLALARSAQRPALVVSVHNGYPAAQGPASLPARAASAVAARAFARLLAQADAVLVPHADALAALPPVVRAAAARRPLSFAPPGVDPRVFHPRRDVARARDEVAFAARPRPEKGGLVLVEAVRRAPGLRLTLLSPTRAAPELPRLVEAARRALGSRFTLVPDPDDETLARAFSRAAVFAAPSLALDTFHMALLEAAACGAACVRSDAPGLRWARFAPVAPAGDAGAWAEALARAAGRRSELGRAALRASSGFRWAWTAEAALAAYEEALARRPRRSA